MGITVTQIPALNSYVNDFCRVKAIPYGSYIKFRNEKRVFGVSAVAWVTQAELVTERLQRGVKCAQLIVSNLKSIPAEFPITYHEQMKVDLVRNKSHEIS